jgi:hypothetical protein
MGSVFPVQLPFTDPTVTTPVDVKRTPRVPTELTEPEFVIVITQKRGELNVKIVVGV